jgi:hypothetical protein
LQINIFPSFLHEFLPTEKFDHFCKPRMKLLVPFRYSRHLNRLLSSVSTSEDALPKTPLFPTKPRGTGEAFSFEDYKKTSCMAGNGGNGMVILYG